MLQRTLFLDVGFDNMIATDALRSVLKLVEAEEFSYVVTPNVDHVVKLHRDRGNAALWRSYDEARLCLCDSRILQMLATWSRIDLGLVPGSDLTVMLLDQPSKSIRSICVVGGTAKMVLRLKERFPSRRWHHHIPPMGVRTDPVAQEQIICFVEDASADLTFMAIGAPQSELLCRQLANRGCARGVALCVGASLEFVTGEKRRAPIWMQQAKLEWLFRLLSEPRRLFRRYMVDGPRIFRIWFRWQMKRLLPVA